MRSVDRAPWRRWGMTAWRLTLAVSVAMLTSCADGFSPLSSAAPPQELAAAAVRKDAVRLTWAAAPDGAVASYVIERRASFAGPFAEVAQVPRSGLERESWIDTDVAPETVYGYRIVAVTGVGDRSAPSVIAGVRTPPLPGIDVLTRSSVTVANALDPDGYEITIAGPDTVRATVGVDTRRRFSPLRPGRYTVTLNGLAPRCSIAGEITREIEVTDSTATTIIPIEYTVTCKDPSRGDIGVTVAVTGDEPDESFLLDILGEVSDTTAPASERVYSARREVQRATPVTQLSNLRTGTYQVRIDSIAANCTLTGTPSRTVTVAPLVQAAVVFAVNCRGAAPPPSTAPFIWRNQWSPGSAAPNSTVELDVQLDLTAVPGQGVQGAQAEVLYDPAVLRYDDVTAGQLARLTVNGNNPGVLSFVATASGAARTGVVSIAKFAFTVIGTAGASTSTRTQNVKTGSPAAFQDSVRVIEDTLVVNAGGGGTNQPPVAQIVAPGTGVTGTAVSFASTGSSDPDGSIASYAWAFGDNTTATGATASKTYSAAGTYTVTLTVTDNRGATATRTATIAITGGVTPPPAAPVARANGPYSGVAGTPIALSSAGSSNAVSYSWSLGNGQTATGASPSVTYSSAGTYTIVLTATASNGATSTSQTTATIATPVSPRPLVWRNVVQAYDAANNTIALQVVYDLNANIPETTGPEALRSFVVDSLKWDPAKLQFLSLNYGPGMVNVATSQPGATAGRLVLRGTTTPGLDQGNVVIATIRFRPIGTAGQTLTTQTFLGALVGTTATNSFAYIPKTSIVEGQFTLP